MLFAEYKLTTFDDFFSLQRYKFYLVFYALKNTNILIYIHVMAFKIRFQKLRISWTKMALIAVIYKQICNQPLFTSNLVRMEKAFKARLLIYFILLRFIHGWRIFTSRTNNYKQGMVWFKVVKLANRRVSYDGEYQGFALMILVIVCYTFVSSKTQTLKGRGYRSILGCNDLCSFEAIGSFDLTTRDRRAHFWFS